MSGLPRVNCYNTWGKLEEVLLGDVYPAEWYEDYDSESRDALQTITQRTKEDLAVLEKMLIDLGVIVQRPSITTPGVFLDNKQLVKPPICPGDDSAIYGNIIYFPWKRSIGWRQLLTEYNNSPQCSVKFGENRLPVPSTRMLISGRKVLIDVTHPNAANCQDIASIFNLVDRTRVVHRQINGYSREQLAVMRPGLAIAKNRFACYSRRGMENWEVITVDPAIFPERNFPIYNFKFHLKDPSANNQFSCYIKDHAVKWYSYYTKTNFDLGCLNIDDANVVMFGDNDEFAEQMLKLGITVHYAPFRCREFWNGGINDLTLSIRRESSIDDNSIEDFW